MLQLFYNGRSVIYIGKTIMVYSVQNNMAYINGSAGMYDGKINNTSVKYGRNAASNHYSYLEDLKGKPIDKSIDTNLLMKWTKNIDDKYLDNLDKFINENADELNKMPPLDFEYQYMPQGADGKNLDKMALLGAAFEEMDRKISVPVQEMTDKLKQAFDSLSAKALDVNKDGEIDIAEYSASILASDMLSKNENTLDSANIDGKINKKGLYASLAYANEKNEINANADYTAIYNAYNLGEAKTEFLKDSNNTLDVLA